MAASKELITKIVLKAQADGSISKAFKALAKNSDSCINKLSKIGTTAKNAFKTVAGAAAAGAIAAGKAAIDFESAFAGVQKTVNETDTTSYEDLSNGIRELAKVTPAAATEIADVAAAAGQLGIKADDVLSFSKVMIDLGESTNLTSDEAATSIAKLFNVTGTSMSQVSNFGSTLVALGNNAATTESDILAMATRIAGSGKQIGLTEQQILALSTSLSSVGIEAELGGSAISTTMSQIDKDVAKGSKTLSVWAQTAGMSTSEFSKAWKTDAYGALQKVMQGMANTKDEGGNLNLLLEDLGINAIRQGDTLKRLSSATGLMSEMTDLANQSWDENMALTKEANTRYATTASRIQILKNKFTDVGITVGNALLPVINQLIDKMDEINWDAVADKIVSKVQWVIDNFDKVKVTLGILATAFATFKLASFISTVAGAARELKLLAEAMKLSETISSTVKSIKNFSQALAITAQIKAWSAAQTASAVATKIATAAQWLFNTSLFGCPIVWIVAAIIGLIAVIVLLVKNWDKVKEACVKCWEGIKNAVAKVGEWLKNFFTVTIPNAFRAVVDFFKNNWQTILLFIINPFAGAFKLLYEKCEGFRNIVNNVKDWIVKAFNNVVQWFAQLPGKIGAWLTGVWQKITTWGSNLWAKAKEIGSNFVNGVVNFFKQLPYKLGYVIGYAIGTVIKFGIKLWTFATTEIPKFVGKVVSWFAQLPGKIWTWLVNVVTKIGQWAVNLYNKMKTAVTNAINATVNFFKTLPGKIWTWLVNTITKIGQWATNMYAKMKAGAIKAINAVVNFFRTLPSKIWTWLTNTIQKISTWASNMITKMRTAAVNAINAVINWFRQLPSRIWTWLVNAVSKVAQWGSNMVAKAKQAATNVVTNVVNTIKSLPGKLLALGKSIVQGLWNGISNAKDWLIGKIKSFASGIVDGIKAALGINSPSIVMEKLFKWVPKGAANGILNNAKYAVSAVESMGGKITNAASKITPTIGGISAGGISATLPKFGTGGTVTNPQAAIVGDRPETIVPHGNTPRNRALLSEAAKGVGATSSMTTTSFTFAPVINGSNVEENRAMLHDAEIEFERRMEEWLAKNRRLAY